MRDREAIREAIVNGIIHREYTRLGAEVCIDIYDNRIEITSPGSMYSGKKIDKTINSVIASERRNPVLADIFARMKFMERRGSGLKKITDKTNALFNDNNNHAEFYSDNNYFKVIIYNAIFENVNSTVKLSKTEKNILQLIARDCTVTIEKMAMELTITESTIKKALKHLRDHKIVIREGADKNGIWKILI